MNKRDQLKWFEKLISDIIDIKWQVQVYNLINIFDYLNTINLFHINKCVTLNLLVIYSREKKLFID